MSIVAVARHLLPAGAEQIAERAQVRVGGIDVTRERLLELVAGADAIVADPTVPIDAEVLDAAGPQLKVVSNFAVGHDNVDLGECRERGVAVTNTPDVLTNATAELALALTLAAARHMSEAEADLRGGRWSGLRPDGYLGLELSGATFGIVGMGRIGRRYAELVSPMARTILYTATSPKPDAERDLGAERAELAELLTRADVVSVHAPGTPETAGLIGADELRAMRRHAVLVNTSRGSLVDADALTEALRDGSIAAAGLDVYPDEPDVPAGLLEAPNAVLLPHIGSATVKARDAMAVLVAVNVLAVLDGREPPDRVI
jgi:glyoxylate reductase